MIPETLWSTIYEYDTTYRDIFRDVVCPQIRRTRCCFCDTGYVFQHVPQPESWATLYTYSLHPQCPVSRRINTANQTGSTIGT